MFLSKLKKAACVVSQRERSSEKEIQNMESTVRGRLDSISRHLLPPKEADQPIHPVSIKAGQSEDVAAEPVIIGGMVLDIHATPSIPTNSRTTTPGKVQYILGGVGRNVAECMSKLGTKPFMISAVGLDMAGNLLLENWRSAELSIEGILKHPDIETAVVCNVLDINGELAAGVASVKAIETFLTPEWIRQFKYSICCAPVLMVDANLNQSALDASCQMAAESGVPVWFEPVSVAKSRRIASVAKYVTFVSPNEDELLAMANALSPGNMFDTITDPKRNKPSIQSLFEMLKPAICVLLEKGIKIVVVTLGSDGVFLCSKGVPSIPRIDLVRTKPHGLGGQLYETVASRCSSNLHPLARGSEKSPLFVMHFPALPASVARLTGAGDCLVGGSLASICAGLDVMQSLAVGIASAKAAVESETNVPSEYNVATIADDARAVYSAAKVIFNHSML